MTVIRRTHSPLHSIYDECSSAADTYAAEKDGCSFILIGTARNAERAWSCRLPGLGQEWLGVGCCTIVQIVGLETSLDHVFEKSVSVLSRACRSKAGHLPRGKMDTHVTTPARPPQRRTDKAS
jgi:hypothetical protein